MDEVYFAWNDRQVLCGVSLDDDRPDDFVPDLHNLRRGMQRALDRGEVLILYAHRPGDTLSVDRLGAVLALADELGLPFVTFPELAGPSLGAGLAITFDDASVSQWYAQRPLFDASSARVTFFVTYFERLSASQVQELRELYDDGHAVESHGLNHRDAVDYVEEYGLRAYIDDEVVPSLVAMRQAGFSPTTFAYPFGSRTRELDRAILEHVALVRSISYATRSPLIADPCPE